MSASSRMMLALLPPSSRVTRLTLGAANSLTLAPALVEPVKLTMSISGWLLRTSPISLPCPETRLNTPAGSPASWMMSASAKAFRGASLEGLTTMVQPAAMAGATLPMIWCRGKFQGVIIATTPIGSLTTRELRISCSHSKPSRIFAYERVTTLGVPTIAILQ